MDTKMEKKEITHYTIYHKILVVGDGDFSFSLSLANAFGSASNMVATSLDSKVMLIGKYSRSAQNLAELTKLGCTVVHEVDAQTMSEHPLLKPMCFDRIVFNFPHAGFVYQENDIRQIELHKDVVSGFLKSARNMVSDDGEIHVTHKNSHPYNLWEIVKLAEKVNLQLVEKVPFYAYHYLGYVNKRGSGVRCDQSFPVGDCSTFKFAKASVVDLLGL